MKIFIIEIRINKLKKGSSPLFIILLFIFSCYLTACKKYVDVGSPIDLLSGQNVYSTDESAVSVLNGIYFALSQNTSGGFTGIEGISVRAGLSADEFNIISTAPARHIAYYTNNLASQGASTGGFESWSPSYNYIFKINDVLEGLTGSKKLSTSVKKQLIAEARFLRGFFYFYLVNQYGDVPLALSTDWKINSLLRRAPVQQLYQQIIEDLIAARDALSGDFLNGRLTGTTSERTRPTKWAAMALLARVYLYTGDYTNAEAMSTTVINASNLFSLTTINNVFLKNSIEAIWQIQPTQVSFNTYDAQSFIVPSTGLSNNVNPVHLSDQLLNAFESGDLRRKGKNWVDSVIYNVSTAPIIRDTIYFPLKYKKNAIDASITQSSGTQNMSEYLMVLRLGEQWLIRSEARAQLSNLSGAIADIDKIRQRAGLPLIAITNPGITQTALLEAILRERQIELFSEWGHRWFDLKRTGKINFVMDIVTPIKSQGLVIWDPFRQLFPIPQSELDKAPNLIQNPGY